VQRDGTAWLKHTINLARRGGRSVQMFENIKGKDVVENIVTKGKRVRVAHHVRVAKNLVLEFDAVGVSADCRACADVQNQTFTAAKNGFEFRSERIALVFRRNDLGWLRQKDRNAALGMKRGGAGLAFDSSRVDAKSFPAAWTNEDRSDLRSHLLIWRSCTQSTNA
jgi:hypothetical protein